MHETTASQALSRRLAATGWNQRELARRSGIHPTTINAIVKGRASPEIATAVAFSRALGEPLEDLVRDFRPDLYGEAAPASAVPANQASLPL